MSAKMEEYLNRKRSELDVETPDEDAIWDGIKKNLHSQKQEGRKILAKTTLIRLRNIAAAAIILFSLGYIANDIINGRSAGKRVTLSSIDSRLGEKEKEYKTLVGFKTNEVKAFAASDDVVIRQLFEEIKKLDLIYDQAMADLKELGPDEKVINTIFSTYEQRIRLLELIVLETNKINSHENNEKINL
jgi:hypothetical protein